MVMTASCQSAVRPQEHFRVKYTLLNNLQDFLAVRLVWTPEGERRGSERRSDNHYGGGKRVIEREWKMDGKRQREDGGERKNYGEIKGEVVTEPGGKKRKRERERNVVVVDEG